MHLMETGAIMLYLADKYDQFQVKGAEHWRMVEWLMWQMGGLGRWQISLCRGTVFDRSEAAL